MLTKGQPAGRKVYSKCRRCTESRWKLMECPADSRKVDGNFSEARKIDVSLRKVQRMHGKMTKVDERLC